ncbi:hypothetical protein BGX21_009418 [Mortierella sp. AD011]|nr:hypothetical protein BGX20_009417 [Mortierella sp. AD010]KAF9396753.1 hypothetical protein BGX21_009418 [Mortierella sp. AD011]
MSNALRAAAANSLSLFTRVSARTCSRTFSTTTPVSLAFAKKPLNKKITIPKDPYLLSEKVVKFAKNGKLDDAITLVLESPKTRQNEVVWNHLIQESSKLGKTNQSWQLLSDMKKRGFEPNDRTYTILLNALAINSSSPNSVSRAMALYQQIKDSDDMSPTVAHTNALLKVCARKLDYENMQQVYNEMPKSGPNSPDVVTFNILINSFARMGGDKGFNMAWKIWEDCLDAKTRRPDEVDLDHAVVDAILLACREAKSSVYIKRGYRLVESLYGLSLSPATANTGRTSESPAVTHTALERAISPGKALGLGTVLRKDAINPRTVDLLLSICIKLKDYDKAQRYMDLVRTTYPDFKPDSQLISSQMHFQISVKEYEKAIQSWDEIKGLGLQHTPATFKQGLDASCKARNWEKTLEMYKEMRSLIEKNKGIDTTQHRPLNPIVHQQDAWTLASTLKCAVKTKHIPEALQILKECDWTKVIRNSRYPRANSDVAELAVKIYSTALKKAEASVSSGENDSYGNGEYEDPHGLKSVLIMADHIRSHTAETLANYDKKKAQKEAEENEASRSRRAQRPLVDSATSIKQSRGTGEREVPRSASIEQDIRERQEPGWNRLPKIASTERDSHKLQGLGGRRGYGREGVNKNQRSKASYGRSNNSTSRSRIDNTGRFEDAFRISKSFSRDVY